MTGEGQCLGNDGAHEHDEHAMMWCPGNDGAHEHDEHAIV